jgi:hypothetical protein
LRVESQPIDRVRQRLLHSAQDQHTFI